MIKKIEINPEQIVLMLKRNVFWVFIIFISLSIILGTVIFYKYSILPIKGDLKSTEKIVFLNEDFFQKILGQIEDREQLFKAVDSKTYFKLFWMVDPAPVFPSE